MPRKILFLATDAHGGFGGVSEFNRNVLEALSQFDGVEQVTVVPRLADTPLPLLPSKIDYILHGVGGKFRYIAAASLAGLRQAPDLIFCGHINLIPAAVLVKRLTGAAIVLAIHGIDAWQTPNASAAKDIVRHVDLVLSVSRVTRDRFQTWCPLPSDRILVFPNTICLENYGEGPPDLGLAERLGIAGKTVLLTLGRMSAAERYKGFDEVIEAISDLAVSIPDICYVAAGDGDDRPRLEAKARELNVAERVVFTGRVPENEKAHLLRLANLFVLAGSGEGFGIVLLEALACGTPVVGSTLDGTRDALRDGEFGELADPRDPAELRAAILAGLKRPRRVPEGLRYFGFDAFAGRLSDALQKPRRGT